MVKGYACACRPRYALEFAPSRKPPSKAMRFAPAPQARLCVENGLHRGVEAILNVTTSS